VGHDVLIHEFSRSHSDTPHSVGLLWTSDQPNAETSAWQHTTLTTDRHPFPTVVFEPTISEGEQQQVLGLRPRGHLDRHNNKHNNNKHTC
jgi:hypothetical protein